MASAAGFHTFLGSVATTASPLVLDTGGTTTVQETYEVANLSNDAAIQVSNDGGSTWRGVPPGQSLRVFTQLAAAPKIRLAGTGAVVVAPSLRNPTAPLREYQYRVKVSALHSAKVV